MVDQINGLGSQWDKKANKWVCAVVEVISSMGFAAAPPLLKISPTVSLFPSPGMMASHMHSTNCAFSFFLHHESQSEWSSFCSAVVHNSCKKKSDFSCVNFKGVQSGVYLEGFAQRRVSVFHLYHLRLRLSLINLVARSRSRLFHLPALVKPFVFLES